MLVIKQTSVRWSNRMTRLYSYIQLNCEIFLWFHSCRATLKTIWGSKGYDLYGNCSRRISQKLMKTNSPLLHDFRFEFFTLDGEEITVSLYLHQNDSIFNVKESNFVWQGKIMRVILLPHGAETIITRLQCNGNGSGSDKPSGFRRLQTSWFRFNGKINTNTSARKA